MEDYTWRIAHLEFASNLKVGDIVTRGMVLGKMGSSGQSTAIHLHTDCVKGLVKNKYTLADIEKGIYIPSPRQLNYFIDSELLGWPIYITTYYADLEYQLKRKKVHYGYDVVPEDRKRTTAHYFIHWNRSMKGEVIAKGYDEAGYGHYLHIGFRT